MHAVNNALFAILAQVELLGSEELSEAARTRLRLIEESGAMLEASVRALGLAVRREPSDAPAQLDALVRSALELPGLDRIGASFPSAPVVLAAGESSVADLVLLVLVNASSVEVRADGRLVAMPRETRDEGFTLAVAEALVRSLGGALEHPDDGSLQFALPLR
ncbi:MAG TPA: hypothetical protein VHD91_05390 [Gaiellaceae bacterium]|nr:hypothetical protein [Gaiellaceae bacterium]